jgi:HlyD family secretion protein
MVRVLAGNRRTTPELAGTVSRVSPDLTRDERSGQSWFAVRVALNAGETVKLADLRLVPGMQVETFIHTGDRTALDYMLKPLRDQVARSFRER